MVAMTTLALLWGWSREAGVIMLGWCGVLRIGEVFQAKREGLVLPGDAAPGVWYALLKIRLPKTRGRAAKHQSARIDSEDAVLLLNAVFGNLVPSAPLWNLSPGALRRRFAALQSSLGLVKRGRPGVVPYNLSSLRPGGATRWLLATEDAEYVRRKGRWISSKVLEIYLQEAAVATYTQDLSTETRARIEQLCKSFFKVLERVSFFKKSFIPEAALPKLW